MAEITNVKIVSNNINSCAMAIRSHLNAAMAYMRLGNEDLMDLEVNSLHHALKMFEDYAYENVCPID